MKIVVGLGNIGDKYDKTRHNIGFMFLEYLEEKYGFSVSKKNKNSFVGEVNIKGKKVVFVKPTTYMNLSGEAVNNICSWYKEDVSNLIVAFDDIDIPFGDVRYKEKGSGGTHNGMKSVVGIMKTTEISRLKLGIGGLKHENEDLANFVLGRFSKDEILKLNDIFVLAETKLLEFLDK